MKEALWKIPGLNQKKSCICCQLPLKMRLMNLYMWKLNFKQGNPIAVNGETMSPAKLISFLKCDWRRQWDWTE